MSDIQVGMLDPIGAFNSQVSDLIQITEAFKSHENLRAIDYLRAAHTVRENLQALIQVTVTSIMQEVVSSDRVTSDDLNAHMAEVDADMESPEAKIERAIARIAKNFTINTDDLPPGGT